MSEQQGEFKGKTLYVKGTNIRIIGLAERVPCVAYVDDWRVNPASGEFEEVDYAGGSNVFWDIQETERTPDGMAWLAGEDGKRYLSRECELRDGDIGRPDRGTCNRSF